MSDNKTSFTDASVGQYIAAKAKGQQQADCNALMVMFEAATGEPARMWGPSIVGHGAYRYTYESGRSGEAPLAGFAIRGRELVVYLDCEGRPQEALLAKLGKHRMGKSCLYFRQLADLDQPVLQQLVAESIAATRQRHG